MVDWNSSYGPEISQLLAEVLVMVLRWLLVEERLLVVAQPGVVMVIVLVGLALFAGVAIIGSFHSSIWMAFTVQETASYFFSTATA